jgi:hypothetical protein
MCASTGTVIAFGTLAVASSVALAIYDIIFAVVLSQASAPEIMRATAIVASAVSTVTTVLSIGLLIWQIRHRDVAQMQGSGHGRKCTYLLAGFMAVFGTLSDVASAMMLGVMKARISDTPPKIILSSTENVLDGGFAVWAISVITQCIFVITTVVIQRRVSRDQLQPCRTASISQAQSEMEKVLQSREESDQRKQEASSTESGSSSLKRKSRSGSDVVASIRSSWTNDRSMTSQTKLISGKTPTRSASLDDISKSAEEGFDSWDTSAVDPDAREAVELASPTRTTLLETIPASPATSRSASPGYPLDLEPPKQRKKPRKYSSANALGQRPKTSPSKIESTEEAHIHPLFRTASSEPPPIVTPGTMVTAAPGAGQVISDRSSLRSVQRKWSGSRSSSPLKHSSSLDNVRWHAEDGEEEKLDESGERTITPPIPEWIMTAGSRSSLVGYNSRRRSETGTATEDVEAI